MRKEELTAEAIGIESPCNERWEEMTGDEKTRLCSHCDSNVNDISKMTENEAFSLIAESKGNLCIQYEPHPITKAPIFTDKLYQITRQTGVTAGVLGATLAVATTANADVKSSASDSVSTKTSISSNENSSSRLANTKPKASPTPTPKRPIRLRGKIRVRYGVKNPLMKAVQRNQTLKVRLMIAKGANVNEKDGFYHSRTALHIAVGQNNIKMAQLLLNSGADLESRDRFKNTPLLNLRYSTSPNLIRLLIQHGADINAGDRAGQTALMKAASSRNIKVVKALLESGAEVNLRDRYKKSALDLTQLKEIKELLIAYGGKAKTR